VAQLVDALSYKVAGFIPDAVIKIFKIILPTALWTWGQLACNRNEYQEYFLGGGGEGAGG
jgi:hypothetical protein